MNLHNIHQLSLMAQLGETASSDADYPEMVKMFWYFHRVQSKKGTSQTDFGGQQSVVMQTDILRKASGHMRGIYLDVCDVCGHTHGWRGVFPWGVATQALGQGRLHGTCTAWLGCMLVGAPQAGRC